jgi:thioredoxin 1
MVYKAHSEPEPSREEVDQMTGPVLLEFGATWCGYCQALQPELAEALAAHPELQHIKVEDGKGKPLGRSFRVKLWPTLVFLRNGRVIKQISRPSAGELQEGLALLTEGAPPAL